MNQTNISVIVAVVNALQAMKGYLQQAISDDNKRKGVSILIGMERRVRRLGQRREFNTHPSTEGSSFYLVNCRSCDVS